MINDITEYDVALDQTAAPELPTQPELELIHKLEDKTGAVFPDVPKAIVIIEQAFESAGDERGADCIKRMAARLEGTAAAEALRRVITDNTEPLRDAAARVGVSHVAIFKQEKTIRKRLGLTAAPPIES